MKVDCNWNGSSSFIANINGFKVHVDRTSIDAQNQSSPKYLVLAALCTAGGMDVVTSLKKIKQLPEKFRIEAEAETLPLGRADWKIKMKYVIDGPCNPRDVVNAVKSSTTYEEARIDVSLNGKRLNYKEMEA